MEFRKRMINSSIHPFIHRQVKKNMQRRMPPHPTGKMPCGWVRMRNASGAGWDGRKPKLSIDR